MKVTLPTSSNFPSAAFINTIEHAARLIAPERIAEFERITSSVELEITDSAEWECHAMGQNITISRKAVEVVWAFCHAYWTVYKEELEGKQPWGQIIDLTKNPKLDGDRILIDWAVNLLSVMDDLEIPDGVPNIQFTHELNDEQAILELTRVTIAFLIQHEIGHTQFIGQYTFLLEEEKACDEYAAKWILGQVTDKRILFKRALGVSTGLLIVNSIGIFTGDYNGVTHPYSYDRLFHTLEKYVEKENDQIWGWVVGMLALHCTQANLALPRLIFDNFFEAASVYRDLLEQHQQGSRA